MKNIYINIKNFIKNSKWWTALIILVVIVILYFMFGNKKSTVMESVIVEKHNVSEEVSVTGSVKPFSDLDLSFETSGQVSNVAVSIGDKVYKGQYLASLSNADLSATVEQAKAGLKITQSKLAEMKSGTRPEELAVSQSTLYNSMASAYTVCDDAIRNDVDQMFENPRSSSAKIVVSINDFQLQNDINTGRYNVESILRNWSANPTISAELVLNYTDLIRNFLDKVAYGLSSLLTDPNTSQTTIDKYKAAVSSARAAIDIARSNVASAKANYDLKLAGNTFESIVGQEASVEQAQANVNAAQAMLDKSIIISPIDGVITKVVAKVGQTMQPGISALSVISYGKYEIEAFVPEADIAKIQIGNVATTTLDAYGSDIFFETSVIKIDPGETVIENVPTYKITLKFASPSDNRIKSGMTANMDILTKHRDGVLAIPPRSIYTAENQKFVKLINLSDDSTKITEQPIEIGIRSVDGYVEIISGLKEGDKVVASPNM